MGVIGVSKNIPAVAMRERAMSNSSDLSLVAEALLKRRQIRRSLDRLVPALRL